MLYRLIIALLMFLFVVRSGYSKSFRDNNNMGKETASELDTRYTTVLFFFKHL